MSTRRAQTACKHCAGDEDASSSPCSVLVFIIIVSPSLPALWEEPLDAAAAARSLNVKRKCDLQSWSCRANNSWLLCSSRRLPECFSLHTLSDSASLSLLLGKHHSSTSYFTPVLLLRVTAVTVFILPGLTLRLHSQSTYMRIHEEHLSPSGSLVTFVTFLFIFCLIFYEAQCFIKADVYMICSFLEFCFNIFLIFRLHFAVCHSSAFLCYHQWSWQ